MSRAVGVKREMLECGGQRELGVGGGERSGSLKGVANAVVRVESCGVDGGE